MASGALDRRMLARQPEARCIVIELDFGPAGRNMTVCAG